MSDAYRQAREQRARHKRVVLLMPEDEIEAIDRWGVPIGMDSRTAAIRELVKRGLETASREGAANA